MVLQTRLPGLLGVSTLVLALTILGGCGGDQPAGRVGETIIAGDYQVTVSKIENPAERPDRFTNPKPAHHFVKFDVKVTNTGSQHLPVWASHFSMQATSAKDSLVYAPRSDISGDTILKQASLSPGQSIERVMYFDVDPNLTPAQLVFSPGVVGWRTRVTVNLGS